MLSHTWHRCLAKSHIATVALGALIVFVLWFGAPATAADKLTDDEALEIAVEAYFYAFPMVVTDVTRKISTNCETPGDGKLCAPMNQFIHVPAFPDASFTDVVRANADTLYSTIFFDLTKEPLVFHVPDSNGRYYLLPMLDMWSDVFAAPGSRTTGTQKQTFILVGPKWSGTPPEGVEVVRSPTNMGWMIGRTQTNGKDDYANVHKFQAGLKAVPLSSWGKDYTPPRGQVDPKISTQPPVKQMEEMDAATFFARFAELMKDNPPHHNDYPMIHRMKQIGIEPGNSFDLAQASPQIQKALKNGVSLGLKRLKAGLSEAGTVVNSWRILLPPIGTYGTDYFRRAVIAYGGLGANVIEDAFYPQAYTDEDGNPFISSEKYILHFKKDEIPPVRAFWSLTMYNDRNFFADNPIDRYAIGDRDELKFNDNGSLTLYIQRESPGKDKESNWLPAPKSGGFSMSLRLYWPKPEALDGTWNPPAVNRIE
jgi:hypothetical protein